MRSLPGADFLLFFSTSDAPFSVLRYGIDKIYISILLIQKENTPVITPGKVTYVLSADFTLEGLELRA